MGKVAVKSGTRRQTLSELQKLCSQTFRTAIKAKYNGVAGRGFVFAGDLDAWSKILKGRREHPLFASAAHELSIGLLCNSQGQYRNGFKSLRLVLELVLQGTYLSANLVALSEWLANSRDTAWAALSEPETGVLSKSFCNAFLPELAEEAHGVNTLAKTLYRELSECIHGNVPKKIPLPTNLAFNEETFTLWHTKLETVRTISIFSLTMRYLNELSREQKSAVESSIADALGHIEAIRYKLELDHV